MKIKGRNCDWVIMSANSWISGKPSIKKIIKENQGNATIMVVQKDDKQIFILGSVGNYGETNETKRYVRDTGNGYRGDGICIIQNTIIIDNNKIIDEGNGIGVTEKRTLYVFK